MFAVTSHSILNLGRVHFTSEGFLIPIMMSFPSLSPTKMWLLPLVTATHVIGM